MALAKRALALLPPCAVEDPEVLLCLPGRGEGRVRPARQLGGGEMRGGLQCDPDVGPVGRTHPQAAPVPAVAERELARREHIGGGTPQERCRNSEGAPQGTPLLHLVAARGG